MLKIAVCDDEQSYLHDIEQLVDEYGTRQGIELRVTTFLLPFDLQNTWKRTPTSTCTF